MATSIDVTADVASIKKAFADIRNEAAKTQAAIDSGLDTSRAATKVNDLGASLTSLNRALEKIGEKSKLDIDVKDATAAVDKLQKRVEDGLGTGKQRGGRSQAEREEDRMHQRRKSHMVQESALKRSITERQSQDAERAFKNYSRNNPHLRQFSSYADFLERGKAQYGKDFSRVRADAMKHISPRAGIFDGAGGGIVERMGGAKGIAGRVGGMAGGLIAGGGGTFGSIGGMLGGAAGLLGGPAGMVVGAVLGPTLGALGRKLDEGVQDAIQEGITSSSLSRAFADTVSGFKQVQEASRDAADGMLMTFDESAQHAGAFASTARMRSPDGLRESLSGAYGFGRGLGVGAGAGTSFMATMRGTGAAADDKAARRVGLSVSEAIQKGGLGPQANEVLSAIQNFATSSTAATFRAPDVTGFASMLAAGNNLGMTGMGASNMAQAMQQVDASIRGGGSYGMASETLSLNAIGSLDPSMDTYESRRVMQGGAFGTIGGAFGVDSAAYKAAKAKGDTGAMQRYAQLANGPNANVSNLEAQMRMFDGVGAEKAATMMGNHFGISMDQASAIGAARAQYGSMDGVARRLEGLGVDISKMDTSGGFHMASVLGMQGSGLTDLRDRMLKGDEFKKLNKDQESMLRGAKGDDQMRDALIKVLSQVGGATSQAEQAKQAQLDMKNNMAKLADGLIPINTKISEGVNAIVEKFAPNTEYGRRLSKERSDAAVAKNDKVNEEFPMPGIGARPAARSAAVAAAAPAAAAMAASGYSTTGADGRKDAINDPRSALFYGVSEVPFFGKGAAVPSGSKSERGGQGGSREQQALAYFMRQGWTKKQAAGIVANLKHESGFKEGAVGDGGRAYGVAQWHPNRQADFEKFSGKNIVGSSFDDQLAFVHHELTEGKERAAGNKLRNAMSATESGSIVSQDYERPANRYGEAAARARSAEAIYASAPIPESPSARAQAGAGKLEITSKIIVQDAKGRPRDDVRAETVSTNYQPVPAGS